MVVQLLPKANKIDSASAKHPVLYDAIVAIATTLDYYSKPFELDWDSSCE